MKVIDIEEHKRYGSIISSLDLNFCPEILVVPTGQGYKVVGLLHTESGKERMVNIASFDEKWIAEQCYDEMMRAYEDGNRVWSIQEFNKKFEKE